MRMKATIPVLAALVAGASAPVQAKDPASAFKGLTFASPECVRVDAVHDRYLVSNINGGVTDIDGNGYISAVPRGTGGKARLKWIVSGRNGVTLNGPKGMFLADGTIYVADIDHVRLFDLQTGKPGKQIAVPGAQFLNDLVVADDGTMFVTGTATNTVFRVTPGGKASKIASGGDLAGPNGIAFDPKGNLVVVTFGADKIVTLSREGKVLNTVSIGEAKLDGVVVTKDGSTYVSSWQKKNVVKAGADGSATEVARDTAEPAAFTIDEDAGRLLVPELGSNAVADLPLP